MTEGIVELAREQIEFSIPIIVGLVEVFKKVNFPNRFLPLLDLVFGLVFSFGFLGLSFEAMVTGVVLGLSAAGLYRGSKVLARGE